MKTRISIFIFMFSIIGMNLYASVDLHVLMERENQLAKKLDWKGFEPASIPALIFDGTDSYLINHPAPPADFKQYNKAANIYVFPGRHELLRSDTATEIGDVNTACLDLEISKLSDMNEIAALLLHEKFHVYQLAKHPKWWGLVNEMTLFEYPMQDPKLLADSFLEIVSLMKACKSEKNEDAECWAKQAAGLRSMRYSKMNEVCAEYERGIELLEGTAQYIQMKSAGGPIETYGNPDMVMPDKVRSRGYVKGALICLLLDRLHPAWKEELNAKDYDYLDVMLKKALTNPEDSCAFDPNIVNKWSTTAAKSVDEYVLNRIKLLDSYLGKPGFKVVFDFSKKPMMPAGFDPMNIEKISPNELLHKHWLKLSNDSASVEILNIECMSEGAGNHPMFNGIKQVIVAGLSAFPDINEANGVTEIKTENISAKIMKAEVEKRDKILFIRLQ